MSLRFRPLLRGAALALALIESSRAGMLVIPFAMSSPEYGVGFGVKARDRDLFGGSGYGDLTAMYTTRKQWFVEFTGLRDSIDGVWRLGGNLEVGVFPDVYGGDGSPVPASALATYTPTYLQGTAFFGRWFPGGIRFDAGLWFDRRTIVLGDSNALAAVAVDPAKWPYGGDQVRATFEGQWNDLDHPDDPHHGATLVAHFEPPVPGSDWGEGYVQGTLVRTPLEAGPIVALRVRHEEATGNIPFWLEPNAGESSILRGLPDYRVRGRAVQTGGLELRQPLDLLGFSEQIVAFGELSRAGDGTGVWSADPVLGFGCGGRLLLDDRHAVLRGDLGWNTAPGAGLFPSIYIDFGQAF